MSLSQAYASAHAESSGLTALLRTTRTAISRIIGQRRQRAQILSELNTYSERQLQDLGISRADFPAIATGTYSR